jgi:uncharacterized membrane protein YeiB
MRISKQSLVRRWIMASVLAAIVFAVLHGLDFALKQASDYSTADLQRFSTAGEYQLAFQAWAPLYMGRVYLNLGFDYLLMPLYAMAFFYSGILSREAFAPRPGRLRRILTMLAAVPLAGAALDALENALEFALISNASNGALAQIAFAISSAKWPAIYVGVALWLGALFARQLERQKRRLQSTK